MATNPSEYSKNPSRNTGNPSGCNDHLGDTNGPKWLVEANSDTQMMIVEKQQKKEAEEKRRKHEKKARQASNKKKMKEALDQIPHNCCKLGFQLHFIAC